jgi:hypothetical protein
MARLLVPLVIATLLLRIADCCDWMAVSPVSAEVHAHAGGHAGHESGGPLSAELCAWMDNSALPPLTAVAGVAAPGLKFLALVVAFPAFAWLSAALRARHARAYHSPPVPRLPLYLRSARLRI